MYWQLEWGAPEKDAPEAPADARRFVLHRHHDARGTHLDLRLEEESSLAGWRIDTPALEGAQWAEEKAPHPLHWLDHDAGLTREDAGVYAWLRHNGEEGELRLWGAAGVRTLRVSRVSPVAPGVLRALRDLLQENARKDHDLPALVEDGLVARQRAMARFCGLGSALDGSSFDARVWRRTLEGLSLREIHDHLRAYETRFDEKYPPQPLSRPETLENDTERASDRALEILRT